MVETSDGWSVYHSLILCIHYISFVCVSLLFFHKMSIYRYLSLSYVFRQSLSLSQSISFHLSVSFLSLCLSSSLSLSLFLFVSLSLSLSFINIFHYFIHTYFLLIFFPPFNACKFFHLTLFLKYQIVKFELHKKEHKYCLLLRFLLYICTLYNLNTYLISLCRYLITH